MTPLHIACKTNNMDIVKLLLQKTDKINILSKDIHDFNFIIFMKHSTISD